MKGNIQSFQDIFKKDFLTNVIDISLMDIATTMALALAIGIVIFLVYRFSFQGVVYNHTFNATLLGMTLITAVLIRTISANVVLSLGMVGALSIVRFRAAVKDPKDIMYLFWAIAMGITCGAGLYVLAIYSTIFIGIVLFILGKTKTSRKIFLLILRYQSDVHTEVLKVLKTIRYSVKSRVASGDMMELTVEVRRAEKDGQTGFITLFSEIEGVEHATLVRYSGDYTE
jgi:uncharacterized membrane protein YhiD involved in acid resistance